MRRFHYNISVSLSTDFDEDLLQRLLRGTFKPIGGAQFSVEKTFDNRQPCTCAGKDDGFHSRHCLKRLP